MNTTALKNFAQSARRQLIEQVGARLSLVLQTDSAEIREKETVVKDLQEQIAKTSKDAVIERVAYTWFNRFCALRFMDVNRYTRIGTVSPPEGFSQPEILQDAKQGHIDEEMVNGKTRQQIFDLLDGKTPSRDPQAEAYRLLLVAACNSWHRPMPFLFERIADYTELLMPDDLLSGNSILASTRETLTPDACKNVEILGWLYQFYISERKDQVMARKSAVPTEDIPAVTQLFTPHWIVRYLVENSLGRLWLLNRPGSRLREHMPYYIEGEAETDFLKITKPEEIRLCDPAVGSGHMLTYAFDLLTLIYEEEGYAPTEIPALILRHNLYGLEICPRAAQLAELALVFKAREKSRRFFQPEHLVRPHIIELRDVCFEENELRDYIQAFGLNDLFNQPMLKLLHQFEEAKNFGSLIQPCLDERAIASARRAIEAKDLGGQLFLRETHLKVLRVLEQAEALTQRYHVVVANPPYLDKFDGRFRTFAADQYPLSKANTYSMFIERCGALSISSGTFSLITLQGWMFLSSYDEFRRGLFSGNTIISMAHLGARAFDSIGGEVVACTAFVAKNKHISNFKATYFKLVDGGSENDKIELFEKCLKGQMPHLRFCQTTELFGEITGGPIAYWSPRKLIEAFKNFPDLGGSADPRSGMATGDNDRFLRNWPEVSVGRVSFDSPSREAAMTSQMRWFPYNKGGTARKWYGNNTHLVFFHNDGCLIKETKRENLAAGLITANNSKCWNQECYFLPCLTWSALSTTISVRRCGPGYIFDTKGQCLFSENIEDLPAYNALLNSKVAETFLEILTPTLDFNSGYLRRIPDAVKGISSRNEIDAVEENCLALARADWDNFETSWDFRDQPFLRPELKGATLAASWRNWEVQSTAAIRRMQELETENNRLFIAAYGLDGELSPDVPEEQITLARAEARRDMAAFLSYGVGCMMGRYSLDHPGLILANAGDTLREFLAKVGRPQGQLTFAPDEDGVIPILDGDWFPDDIAERFKKFLKVTFGEAHFEENIQFIEASLGKNIRKYFLTDFYKDHIQTYKKRPIYWLFSSPKGSFNALIYLHRYRPDTVAIVLSDYLREFHTKIISRREHLEAISISASASPAEKVKVLKEIEKLKQTITELDDYERDILYPLATQKIEIDLDDGVKVNYPKFGMALKTVPGLS